MLNALYINEPNDVVIEGLRNDATGNYVNDATLSFEVRTSGVSPTSGSRIGSVRSMPYVAASNGNYRGTFPQSDAASLIEGTRYWVWITGSNVTTRRIEVEATYRDSK